MGGEVSNQAPCGIDTELWKAYCQIYEKCRKAEAAGKRYINIQFRSTGGYRLVASNNSGQESCGFFNGFNVADWASNIMYQLGYLQFFDTSEIDKMFNRLEATGYES